MTILVNYVYILCVMYRPYMFNPYLPKFAIMRIIGLIVLYIFAKFYYVFFFFFFFFFQWLLMIVLVSIVGSLRDREVACSASDRQGSNFESCVWRTVSSQSSHHPQEVLLAQFSLYVHKGGLKPDSFHFYDSLFEILHHSLFLINLGSRSTFSCCIW